MTADPLAIFYTWPITVQRAQLQGAEGLTYDEPDTTIKAKIRMVTEVNSGPLARIHHSTATITMRATTPAIPLESLITLPTRFAAHAGPLVVTAEELHDTGIAGAPSYYQIKVG